jgi:hypothetical protein
MDNMVKDPLVVLRRLAKNDYYQTLYNCVKELGLQMFDNKKDLTMLQLWFLSYLGMYSMINTDVVVGECSKRVLDNTIYEDAYILYKNKSANKNVKNSASSIKLPKQNEDKQLTPKSTWVFKRKQKL